MPAFLLLTKLFIAPRGKRLVFRPQLLKKLDGINDNHLAEIHRVSREEVEPLAAETDAFVSKSDSPEKLREVILRVIGGVESKQNHG